MKLTLYVYGGCKCGYDVEMFALPIEENGEITIRCNNLKDANSLYSTFGKLELDTNSIIIIPTNTHKSASSCIYYDFIKFTPLTEKQLIEEYKTIYEKSKNEFFGL